MKINRVAVWSFGLLLAAASVIRAGAADPVQVRLFDLKEDKPDWKIRIPDSAAEEWSQQALAFTDLPRRYNAKGIIDDRPTLVLIRAEAEQSLAPGRYRLLLRAHQGARLFVNDKKVAQVRFIVPDGSAHEPFKDLPESGDPSLAGLSIGSAEQLVELDLEGLCKFRLEAFAGGKGLRSEIGSLLVAIAPANKPFQMLAPGRLQLVDETGWAAFVEADRLRLEQFNQERRRSASAEEDRYWQTRHEQARSSMPPRPAVPEPENISEVGNDIDRHILAGLEARGLKPAVLIDDAAFLRRLSLDVRGVIPGAAELQEFMADAAPDRRSRWIDRFLASGDWADHWVGYWQEVLAENPGMLKPQLNNTGPFRYWIHEAFLDNKPIDRFVTELVLMEGSRYYGGAAGFAMSSQNDVPMAAKAHVLGTAFLGVDMKCARCHDAPYHDIAQKDLFSMAAMLDRKTLSLPKTSTIPLTDEEIRRMVVTVSLRPGDKIKPGWPFGALMDESQVESQWQRQPQDSRHHLAALVTSPRNDRFAGVIVNRLWKRYMGYGLVEKVDDWEGVQPSHPELLKLLSWELVHGGYDLKHVARLMLNSRLYQREAAGDASQVPVDPKDRTFAAPARRRLTAEQLVDSLFAAAGKPIGSEPLNMDVDGRRPPQDFLDLGTPRRAWQFCSLSNERDRPSLGFPRAQSVVDLLSVFGWRSARPDPITVRDQTLTPLQPLMLANGTVAHRVATLSDDSVLTQICLEAGLSPEQLVRQLYAQVLTREPVEQELKQAVALLRPGFAGRIVKTDGKQKTEKIQRENVSWSNHFSAEANRLKMDQERAARAGDEPTFRLEADWRQRAEDLVWALINQPEFIYIP